MCSIAFHCMSSNTEFHPSRHCRFCNKSVTCSGTKVPRVSLYSVVRNKQLVTFTDSESLILSNVVASLGHKLVRNELLSSVSCLTCARTLTRIYGTFVELVSKLNDGISVPSAKRLSSNSPTGTSPLAKRTRPAGNRTPARCALLQDEPSSPAEKENDSPMAGVNVLTNRMELVMNLPKEDSHDTIMKVTNKILHCC